MARCKAKKKDGRPGPVKARPYGYCWVHDPELARERAGGRRQGGKSRSRPAATLPADTPDTPVGSVADVVVLLAESSNQTRKGGLDPKVANAVGYLASVLLRALRDADLDGQLAELRRELVELKHAECQHAPRDRAAAGGDTVPEGGGGWRPGAAPGGPGPDPEPGGDDPGSLADDLPTLPLYPPAAPL
jgi:hypothetical protein